MTAGTVAAGPYTRWVSYALLVVLFALPCVLGRATTYVLLLAAALLIFAPSIRHALRHAPSNPMDWLFGAVFLALGVAFSLSAEQVGDVRFLANFLPLLVAIPLRHQLARVASASAALTIGWLSLAGTIAAASVGLVQIVGFGVTRVGQIMNPFQYADTTMLLGFLSLAGLFAPGRHNRLIFLAGPLIGTAAVMISGTRGALLALPVLAVIAFCFALVVFRQQRALIAWAGAGGVVLLLIVALVAQQAGLARALEAFTAVFAAVSGDAVDGPVRERLLMLEGGWRAFLASPLYGYGWGDMVPAIYAHVPPEDQQLMRAFRHLHNGFMNFAVAAGSIGIVCFIALLATPIVGALASPRDSQWMVRLYLGLTLSAAFFVFELTFILLGFEFHTVQYAFMSAALFGFIRDTPDAQSFELPGNSAVGPRAR